MVRQPSEPRLTVVFQSQGVLPAEVVKSKLEANGISAILKYQSLGRVLAVTIDGLGLVEVLVNSDDAALARSLLTEDEGDLEGQSSPVK